MKSGCYIILNRTRSTDELLNVKIGCSKNCESRFNQIKASYRFNGSDDELILMQIIPCVQYKRLEKILHSILKFARPNVSLALSPRRLGFRAAVASRATLILSEDARALSELKMAG
jgi:hypothetical protein